VGRERDVQKITQPMLKQEMPNVEGWPWLDARCPPKLLYHSPSSAGQGRETMMKGSRVKTRMGRAHSPVTVTDKTDRTWGENGV